jgi:diguanylate cyclase (GGDEF)-like protein
MNEDNPLTKRMLQEQDAAFSSFMRFAADLECSEAEARRHYRAILDHAEHLKRQNGRQVGFHVAMCDYLVNIAQLVECPKLMRFGKYEELMRQSTLDELTGLYNRRCINEQIERELHRSRRYNMPFSLLMVDIDNFKAVNDNHGHPLGDAVLREFARIMRDHLRTEDSAARFGGEEFMVLLPQTDMSGACAFGERILDKTRRHRFPEKLNITFSGGIATYPNHAESVAELLKVADRSLYDAKLGGKGQIRCTGEDRRSASRYSAEVGFKIYDHSGKERSASMRDISISGLAANADVPLKPGEQITLRLHDTRDRLAYTVEARVVWVRPQPRQDQEVLFGAKYTERNPNLISHFIKDYTAEG